MLIGCNDCAPANKCDIKALAAVILPAGSPDSTGSYCPHTYDCTTGTCLTECSAAYNMIQWLLGQWTDFHNDTTYPWNTYTSAVFTDSTSTSPSSITGPGVSGSYGGTSYGSNYTVDYPAVAEFGPSVGSLCAYAQIVAFRMSGSLFISPSGVSGKTESCLAAPLSGGTCSAAGVLGSGTYYIPLPPYDLCTEENGSGPVDVGIQVSYLPFQSGNSVDCLPTYAGGAYTNCQSPDPFFGSDPP